LTTYLHVLTALCGVAILYWGASWLIRGSAQIARAFGVKPLVVGLTVVAYGASAPELTIATKNALTHHEPIALGVVVGSCAANISLILGITALISPPTIDGRIIRREVPVLLGSAIAVPLLFRNGVLSRFEGLLLIVCALVFTVATLTVSSRLEPDDPLELEARRSEDSAAMLAGKGRPLGSRGAAALQTAFGLLLLVAGADLFMYGGRGLGKDLGMSERMLGLTVISERLRTILLVPVIYLGCFVWENVMLAKPEPTRYIVMGVILVALMILRPNGLLGEKRVEIV